MARWLVEARRYQRALLVAEAEDPGTVDGDAVRSALDAADPVTLVAVHPLEPAIPGTADPPDEGEP